MELEFRARVADLKGASRELALNRDQYKVADFVDLLVSDCIATFRSVGTSREIPVAAIRVGCARLPLQCLETMSRVARTFGKHEATVWIGPGVLKIGSWSYKNVAITLGIIPDQHIDMPTDASIVDTLAISKLLPTERIVEQGLKGRVEVARKAAEEACIPRDIRLSGFGYLTSADRATCGQAPHRR